MRKAVQAEKRVDVIEKEMEMEKRDTTSFERERERDKVSNDNNKVKKRGWRREEKKRNLKR